MIIDRFQLTFQGKLFVHNRPLIGQECLQTVLCSAILLLFAITESNGLGILSQSNMKIAKVSFLQLFEEHGIDNGLNKLATDERAKQKVDIDQQRSSKSSDNPALVRVIDHHDRRNDEVGDDLTQRLCKLIDILGNTLISVNKIRFCGKLHRDVITT